MKAFCGTNDEYTASIAVDASTIGDVTVATAIYATRHDEIAVLDSLLEGARSEDVRFVPFKSKSRHFDKVRNASFFECVVTENEHRARSLYFQHHSSSRNQHYVESVLTAILAWDVSRTVERSTFVLIDGDEQKADDFARAFSGFSESPPTTTNCFQSELYYPHALLADLSAGYLAHKLHMAEYDYVDPVLRTSPANRKRSEKWGKAFDHLQTKPEPYYQRLDAESAYAETKQERAEVWFEGAMGRNPPNSPPAISLTTIVAYLENRGHVTVAKRLREL